MITILAEPILLPDAIFFPVVRVDPDRVAVARACEVARPSPEVLRRLAKPHREPYKPSMKRESK